MTCNVKQKADMLKELSEVYTKDVRALLEGRTKVSTDELNAVIDYLAAMEASEAKKQKTLETFDSEFKKAFNTKGEGGFRVVNTMGDTGGSNTPYPANLQMKVGGTVFTDMDFVLKSELDKEGPRKDDDLRYVIDGELEKSVQDVRKAVLDIFETNGISNTGEKGSTVLVLSGTPGGVVRNTPALGLLLAKVGNTNTYKLNVGSALALVSGMNSALADNTGNLLGYKDDEMIADIVGVEPDKVTDYLRYRFGNGGMGLSLIADSIGNAVSKNLGLRITNKNYAAKDTKKIISSFGLVAAQMLESRKDIAESMTVDLGKVIEAAKKDYGKTVSDSLLAELKSKEYSSFWDIASKDNVLEDIRNTLGFDSIEDLKAFRDLVYKHVHLQAKGIIFQDIYMPNKKTDNGKGYRAAHKYLILKPGKATLDKIKSGIELFKDFTEDNGKVREPSFEKPNVPQNRKKRRDKYSKLSELQHEYLDTAESIPYEYNTGMEVLMSMLEGKTETEQRAMLRKALGYPETVTDASQTMQVGNKSRQDRIDKVIDDNLDLYKRAKEQGKPFYFNYFVPGNNRAMVDSSTVNMQSDKHLARWLVSQSGVDKTFKSEDLKKLLDKVELSSEEAKNLNPHILATMLGTVQGFDGSTISGNKVADIEKNTIQEIFESFKAIVKAPESELEAEVLKDDGHLGQKLTAMHVVKALNKGDAEIHTDVTYEVDGLTNALFYRLLQTPLHGYEDMLEKVGVIHEAGDAEHMGDVKAKQEGYMDNYMAMSSMFRDNLEKIKRNPKLDLLIDNGLFVVKDFTSEVDSGMRNFAKPGTMIVNYGAGIKKIVDQAIDDYLKGSAGKGGLLDNLVAKDKNGYVVPNRVVEELLGVDAAKVEKFRDSIRNLENTQLENLPEYKTLYKIVQESMGETKEVDGKDVLVGPLVDALNEMFGGYVDLGNLSTSFYNTLYGIFIEKLNRELGGTTTKDKSNEELVKIMLKATPDEIREAVYKLRKYFPSLVRPDSVVVDNNTTIIGKTVGLLAKEDPSLFHDASTLSKVTGNRQSRTVNGITSNIASFLADVFSAPGAKALPFGTHTKDGRDAMETSLKVFKETGSFPLQIFDALTLDGSSIDTASIHNKVAMLNNLRDNSLEDTLLRIREINSLVNDPELVENLMELEDNYKAVQVNRAEVFGKKQAVFQMSGTVKSRYDYDPVEVKKEETEHIKKAFKDLNKILASSDIADFSPDILKQLKELESMSSDIESGKIVPKIYDISWSGLEEGKLADILQVIREANTALRTIKGVSIDDYVYGEGSKAHPEPSFNDMPIKVKQEMFKRVSSILGVKIAADSDMETVLNKVREGC